MSPADRLIERLDGVHPSGLGKWMARCPAHEDRNPSLKIEEVDGRALVHCFAGCGAADVMAAVGLSLADLFEKPPEPYQGARTREIAPGRQRASAEGRRPLDKPSLRLALFQAERDSLRLAVAAENLARGIILTDEDRAIVVDAAASFNRLSSQFRLWEF